MEDVLRFIKSSHGMNISIIGKNGAGKSTFVKELLGINQNDNKQKIDLKGNIIFQNPENNIIEHIVYDDISFGLINHNFSTSDINERVNHVAINLNILDILNKNTSTLSGGQKQRVAIAGVTVLEPKYIIFDEVTSMLDPVNKRNVLSLISQLNKVGITTLTITHDYDEALSADHLIHIHERKIKQFGTPIEVFDQFKEEYLPVRYKLCKYLNKATNLSMETLVTKNINELVGVLWTLHSHK